MSDVQRYLERQYLGLPDEELDELAPYHRASSSKCSVLESPSTKKQNAGHGQNRRTRPARRVIRDDHSGLGHEIFATEIP